MRPFVVSDSVAEAIGDAASASTIRKNNNNNNRSTSTTTPPPTSRESTSRLGHHHHHSQHIVGEHNAEGGVLSTSSSSSSSIFRKMAEWTRSTTSTLSSSASEQLLRWKEEYQVGDKTMTVLLYGGCAFLFVGASYMTYRVLTHRKKNGGRPATARDRRRAAWGKTAAKRGLFEKDEGGRSYNEYRAMRKEQRRRRQMKLHRQKKETLLVAAGKKKQKKKRGSDGEEEKEDSKTIVTIDSMTQTDPVRIRKAHPTTTMMTSFDPTMMAYYRNKKGVDLRSVLSVFVGASEARYYVEIFQEEEIDLQAFRLLDMMTLKELGISVGTRLKFMDAIRLLKNEEDSEDIYERAAEIVQIERSASEKQKKLQEDDDDEVVIEEEGQEFSTKGDDASSVVVDVRVLTSKEFEADPTSSSAVNDNKNIGNMSPEGQEGIGEADMLVLRQQRRRKKQHQLHRLRRLRKHRGRQQTTTTTTKGNKKFEVGLTTDYFDDTSAYDEDEPEGDSTSVMMYYAGKDQAGSSELQGSTASSILLRPLDVRPLQRKVQDEDKKLRRRSSVESTDSSAGDAAGSRADNTDFTKLLSQARRSIGRHLE